MFAIQMNWANEGKTEGWQFSEAPDGERTWTSIGRALEAFWESTREWPGISHRIVRVLDEESIPVEVMAVFDINNAIFEIEERLALRD